MFRSKTVLVVGAGASCEANLPSGEALKSRIAKLLDFRFEYGRQLSGCPRIIRAIHQHTGGGLENVNPYIPKAHFIRDVVPDAAMSIDNLLDAHSDDKELELCGKLAIVKAILDAEADSNLRPIERHALDFDYNSLKDSWYHGFIKLLYENVRKPDIASIFENVSIITFNYDRCIERYLTQGLSFYYRISREEAEELVRSLTIIHPYGQVGCLPWQKGNRVRFGDNTDCDLLEIAKGIKTFTEGMDDEDMLASMRGLVAEAETLVFLGFAFHRQNMELIEPGRSNIKRVFATTKDMSTSNTVAAKMHVAKILGRAATKAYPGVMADGLELYSHDNTCSSLFADYGRAICAEE